MGDIIFNLLVQRTYSVMTNDVLISIPLFVFMGYIVERANILDRLFRSLQLAAGPMPASLALATLATCAIFATATGIVGAVVTLMGLLAYPAMLRAGYDAKLSAGVVCAGGCLGILIPPSVMLILYGATAGVSVVKLYAGAFFPGLMLAGLYILYVVIMTLLNPKLAPQLPPEERKVPVRTVFWALVTSFLPLAALIGAALGSIIFGIATPSEAAAMGSLGALLLAVAYGADYSRRRNLLIVQVYGLLMALFLVYALLCGFTELRIDRRALTAVLFLTLLVGVVLIPNSKFTVNQLKESVFLTARTTAMVCWLFIGSFTFSAVFAYLGGHEPIEKFVLWMNLSPTGFMILAQIIIFLLGWPLEWTEIIVIFMPIFLPLLKTFNVDPLFFGLLVALNIQTSFLSPPVAMAPFYLKGVAPAHVSINEIFRGVMPFNLLVILAMVILYLFPEIGLWLPRVLYN
jgi:TRAP-type mannitol/chloroaromatic compound transport system permease large subunit